MSSETASFTDPQFLAHFGLSRANAIEYFLHPLNPFRSKAKTCNEVLQMQGITIGQLMYSDIIGTQQSGPLSLERAEEEYNAALARLPGEQYELLMPPSPPKHTKGGTTANNNSSNNNNNNNDSQQQQDPMTMDPSQSPLFTIRHIYRTKNKVTTLGIYYILEGVIYKSPSARALMKYNVARTCQGLIDTCDTLSKCANYTPTTGYYWDFEAGSKLKKRKRTAATTETKTTTEIESTAAAALKKEEGNNDHDHHDDDDEIHIFKQLQKIKKSSTVVGKRIKTEERTDEEEEEIRAKDKINSILLRLSKSSMVTGS
jgi:hypothetical protein